MPHTKATINPLLAMKMVDKTNDIVLSHEKPDETRNLDRAGISEIINEMHRQRMAAQLIISFFPDGDIRAEMNVKGESLIKLITEKKV